MAQRNPALRADARRSRDAIIDAALQLLATTPSMTMDDVARGAGVGRATVFRHFASQEDLFDAALERAFLVAGEALAAAELDRGPVTDALRRAIDTLVALSTEFSALAASLPLGDERANARVDELLAPVADLIGRGQSDGAIDRSLPVRWLVDVLVDMSFGAAFRGHARSTKQQGDLVERTFWLGAHPERGGDRG
jgi:AcrR family transcriptional regulator